MIRISASYAQFLTVKASLGAQAIWFYAKDATDPLKVGNVAVIDPKAGGELAFEIPDLPLVAQLLIDVPGALEVEGIG